MLENTFDERNLFLRTNDLYTLNDFIKSKITIKIKHYSMIDFGNSYVVEMAKSFIKIRFEKPFPHLNFFESDPIILIATSPSNEIFRLSGNIIKIHSLNPLEISVEILKVESKSNLRRAERFFVSLPAHVISNDLPIPNFAVIKNISLTGFKMNCKEDYDIHEIVTVSIAIDRLNKIACIGKVIRKNRYNDFFVYGMEIRDITEINKFALDGYIRGLASGQ